MDLSLIFYFFFIFYLIEFQRKNSNLFCFSLVFCYRHDEGINVTEQQGSSQIHHHSLISNNNLRSSESNIRIGGTYRKKKPAPLPPTKKESCFSDQPSISKVECNFKYIYNYIYNTGQMYSDNYKFFCFYVYIFLI